MLARKTATALALAAGVWSGLACGCRDGQSVAVPSASLSPRTDTAAPDSDSDSAIALTSIADARPTPTDADWRVGRNADASEAGSLDARAEVALVDAGPRRPPRGPYYVDFLPDRPAFVVLPSDTSKPHRLIAGLHGVCTPPAYSCGKWLGAAAEAGVLVCPTGNAPCADSPSLPTWEEPFTQIDDDLEASITKVSARYPGEITRKGAILTGYSRGAYAAAIIAARHPGRWPLLILNEADTELSLPMLRGGKIRAVALIAGEWGNQIAGERKNVDDLAAQGYPIRLWVMPKAGHAYSANIEDIMREAITFVISHEQDG